MDPERLQPREPQPQPQMQRPEPRPDSPPKVQHPGERPGSGPSNLGGGQTGPGGPPEGNRPGPGGGPKPGFLGGKTIAGALAVVVLGLGGWLYMGSGSTATGHEPWVLVHSTAGAVYTGPEELAPNYNKNKNADVRVPAVLASEDIDQKRTDEARQAALRGDPIPGVNNPSPAFVDAVKRGDVKFYAVRAYDTCAEDGDVVTLRIPMGGEIGPIPLTIAGTVVTVPVVTGQPATMQVVAVKDGVGGVTLGVQTSGGVWFSKVMAPGETETMNLSIH